MGKLPFIRFCVSVWGHWEARFGTTFAVMLSLVQYIYLATGDPAKIPRWAKAFPPYLWLAVAGVLLFWSCFAAWRDQDEQRETLKSRLATPDIHIEIAMVSWGSRDKFFAIFAALSASNPHGPPTGLFRWKAELELADLTRLPGEIPFSNPKDIRIPLNKDNTMILPKDKEIGRQTASPIPTGGVVDGWLMSVFRTLPAGFDPIGTRITFSCRDIATGKDHSEFHSIDRTGEFTLPGVGLIKTGF
jgi:hypothetical protein